MAGGNLGNLSTIMKHYPETRKSAIIAKMTGDTSLKQLAKNEKISLISVN